MRRNSVWKLQIVPQKIFVFFSKHLYFHPVIRIGKQSKEYKHDGIFHNEIPLPFFFDYIKKIGQGVHNLFIHAFVVKSNLIVQQISSIRSRCSQRVTSLILRMPVMAFHPDKFHMMRFFCFQ